MERKKNICSVLVWRVKWVSLDCAGNLGIEVIDERSRKARVAIDRKGMTFIDL